MGTVAALESVFVNMRKICQGLLYFPIQGGVQPGIVGLGQQQIGQRLGLQQRPRAERTGDVAVIAIDPRVRRSA